MTQGLLAYRALLHRCSAKTRMMISREQTHQCDVCRVILSWSYLHDNQENTSSDLLTPISRARSEPSRRMMLQGRAFLLYFPGRVFLPVVGFWSARPLTFRRLKNLSILAHTGATSRVTKVQHITIFISSWFLVWSGPVFLPIPPKHISEIGVYNDLPDLTVSLVASLSNTITIALTRPS